MHDHGLARNRKAMETVIRFACDQRSRERFEMLTKPVDQLTTPDVAGREIEHEALLVVHGRVDLAAVENKKSFHGSVPHTLVAVHKRVVLHQ